MEYLGGGKWESMEVHHRGGFKDQRPMAEKKTIVKVAKVAAVAAAVYYGGPFLAGATGVGTTTAAAYGSLGALEAGSAFAAAGGSILSAGALAMQGVGMIQQRAAANDMQAAEEKRVAAEVASQEIMQKESAVAAQRQRIATTRERNIRAAYALSDASRGTTGLSGSSIASGAISGTSTQMGANIGFINQAEGFAAERSSQNIASGRASSDIYTANASAEGWKSFSALGQDLGGADAFKNTAGALTTIFSRSAA